jgi:hypothetical protein
MALFIQGLIRVTVVKNCLLEEIFEQTHKYTNGGKRIDFFVNLSIKINYLFIKKI